jgi:formate hydrogenlyase subunit 6/NADH:ubiquinone oxidoreductase subunit I
VDAVYIDSTGEPFVCLHCGKCVPFCPHDCLEMADREAMSTSSRIPREVEMEEAS